MFDFPLTGELPDVQPRIPVTWVVKPHPDWSARGGSAGDSIFLIAFHNGVEIYHSEAITDYPYIQRYFPACDLGRRPVYHGDAVTEPAYRGNLLHPAGMTFMYRHYKDRGYDQVLCRVRAANAASLSGMTRAGYRLCARVHQVSVLGFDLRPVGWRVAARRPRRPGCAAPSSTKPAAR